MAIEIKAGSFNTGGIDGALAVTGVGFSPKLVLFLGASAVANTIEAHMRNIVGAATPLVENCASQRSEDLVTTTNCNRRAHNAQCYNELDNSLTTPQNQLVYTSSDADGFTVTRSASVSAVNVDYLAFGGDDVSASLVQWIGGAATTPQAITGAGFAPDAAITFGAQVTPVSTVGDSEFCLGFADTSLGQSVIAGTTRDNRATGQCFRILDDDAHVIRTSISSGNIIKVGSVQSFDADGFTIDWTVNATNTAYFTVFLKGLSVQAGVITAPAAETSTSISLPLIDCKAALFKSVSSNSIESSVVDYAIGYGVSDRTFQAWDSGSDRWNVSQSEAKHFRGLAGIWAHNPDKTSAARGIVTCRTRGIDIAWDQLDGNQAKVAYMAFGDPLPPAPSGIGTRRRRMAGNRR